jgi:Flp pilus assembly protein TadD
LREVAAGHPVLVFQNLGFDAYPFWHYAVVIGYDLEQQELILRSGERKRLLRPFDVFERTWQRAGHWAVVVVPPQVMPVSVREKEFTEAAVAIDSLSAYQSGLERWPGSFELQFALGNKAYASGDYSLSATAFQTATKLAPRRAEAWNNLAYALWKLDQRKPAITAVQKALQLDPDNPNFADSLKEIGSQSQ